MCEIKRIDRREDTERYYRILQEDESDLPSFLYEDPRYQPLAVCYQKKGKFAGLSYGIMQKGDCNFYMHYLRLTNSGVILGDVVSFSQKFFDLLMKEYGRKRVVMNIDQNDDTVPQYAKILKTVSNCCLENLTFYRQVGIDTKRFSHFRKFHWYCPGLMDKKGYEAMPLDACKGTWRENLIEKEAKGEVSKDYLSPGVWESGWEYDPNTSYVMVKKGDQHPLGWIVTERVSEDTVKIRRFYIYDEIRRLCLGPSFSTWVLERIEERYGRLLFEVEKGNRQMEMFTNCYCKPILAFDYYRCNIKLKLGGKNDGMDTGEIK